MHNLKSRASHLRLLVITLALLCACSLKADTAYVTTYTSSTLTTCPPYCANPLGLTTSISASGSSAIAAPPGVPSRTKCTFGFAGPVNWSIQPTLGVPGGVYTIELAHTSTSSCNSNTIFTVYSPDGTVSSSCTNIPYMQKAYGSNGWVFVGYITNNPGITQPTIIFYYVSGQIDNSGAPGNRVYIDAFKFTYVDPCLGMVGDVNVTGPLAANQTFVNVTGVTDGATNVTVYANGSEIGETNYSAGFAAGALTVPTTALSKDQQISATQAKNGCSSSLAATGPVVGGGANPNVTVALGLIQSSSFAGPAGTPSNGAGTPYWLGATGLQQGSASAPTGAQELLADQCWHTITFDWTNGAGFNWVNGATVNDANPFAALEHIAIAIDGADSGPYDIYVDDIMNGDTLIEGFEGYPDGTPDVTFVAPDVATQPSPAATYLDSPNSSSISQAHAFSGTNALRIQWQFKDTEAARWARVLAASSTGAKYPQLDTHKPVSMRILLLPVGGTTDHKFNGSVGPAISNSGPPYQGGTNVLSIAVTGPGPYTYQWSFNNGGLSGPTDGPTYTIGDGFGVSFFDDGVYTVAVSDGICTETRSYAFTSVAPTPTITNQPAHVIVQAGGTAVFTVGADGHTPNGYPLNYQWHFNNSDLPGETGSSLTIPNAQIANAGSYSVTVANGNGSVDSVKVTLDVVPVGVTAGTGTGLEGNYYGTHYPTNAFAGAPSISRLDPTVNFDFGSGSPDPSVSADHFTARWVGQVQALGSDTYTFSTISDDGVRLWVNGQKLIDNWTAHSAATNSATIALTGTQKYDLLMEYFENASTATAKLYWSNASGGISFEPVPATQLYPGAAGPLSPSPLAFSLNGANLRFTWGPGQATLAWSTNVAGPYTNTITGVVSPFTNTIGPEPQKFFRLQVQ